MTKHSGRVSVQRGKEVFTAFYQISRGAVLVTYWDKSNVRRDLSAPMGDGTVETVAQRLLEEILRAIQRQQQKDPGSTPNKRESPELTIVDRVPEKSAVRSRSGFDPYNVASRNEPKWRK